MWDLSTRSHTHHIEKNTETLGGNCVKDVEAVSRFVEAVKTVELCRAAVELSIL